jgi:hypothetical protein
MAISLTYATFKIINYLRFRMLKQTQKYQCNSHNWVKKVLNNLAWRLGNKCSRPHIWHNSLLNSFLRHIWRSTSSQAGLQINGYQSDYSPKLALFMGDSHNHS